MFKTSRRAFGVATALTLSAVFVAPSASAALLGSGGSNGGSLPVTNLLGSSNGLLGPVTGLLGNGGAGGLLGNGLPILGRGGLGSLLGGGLPLLGNGGLGNVLGGGLPLLGSGGISGADASGGDLVNGVFEAVGGTTLACDAAIPQLLQNLAGGVGGSLCEFNPFDGGLVGLLSSL